MRKLLLPFLFLLSQIAVFPQAATHLPYSIFGIGEINTRGSVRNMGMGRSGLALSSDFYLNNLNPASYHTIDSVSFFFDIGFNATFVKYQTTTATQYGRDVNLRNFAIGFRITRNWSSSLGIAPFSTVAYKIESESDVEGTIHVVLDELTGKGGLNQLYWDNSYLLFNRLSLGVNFTYLFGNIETVEKLHYNLFENDIYAKKIASLKKLYADFGLQYYFPIKEKTIVTLGGVFGNAHKLNYEEELTIYDSQGTVSEQKVNDKGTFNFPLYYGGGIAVEFDKKLTFSADYLYHDWSKAAANNKNFRYHPTNTFRVGVEYVPGPLSQYGYVGRVRYRAGYYHEDCNLEINKTTFSDDGISLGLGLPFLQNKSSVNIAYNYGIKGTLDNALIKEKYHMIIFSVTLHDWWFIKKQYD
jgi:hypothetical protein